MLRVCSDFKGVVTDGYVDPNIIAFADFTQDKEDSEKTMLSFSLEPLSGEDINSVFLPGGGIEQAQAVFSSIEKPSIILDAVDREHYDCAQFKYIIPVPHIATVFSARSLNINQHTRIELQQTFALRAASGVIINTRYSIGVLQTPDEIVALIQQAQPSFQILEVGSQSNAPDIGMPK